MFWTFIVWIQKVIEQMKVFMYLLTIFFKKYNSRLKVLL